MVLLTFSTLPVLAVYLFAQKYIVQGISMTGLKG
jgi:ABC-type glycerol-3-phosphate transport system permease component